jgi:hypothetical protein
MNDVFFVIARPRHIGLPRLKRSTEAMKARDKGSVSTEFMEHLLPHVAHDPHADDHIRRVGQFDPYES